MLILQKFRLYIYSNVDKVIRILHGFYSVPTQAEITLKWERLYHLYSKESSL